MTVAASAICTLSWWRVRASPSRVRGVAATRYRLRIDLARADAALLAGVIVPVGPYRRLGQIPAEAWLDADGLARRIAVMTDPAAGDDGTPTWSITELWDFGVPADITPPGPGDVVSPRDAAWERPPESGARSGSGAAG